MNGNLTNEVRQDVIATSKNYKQRSKVSSSLQLRAQKKHLTVTPSPSKGVLFLQRFLAEKIRRSLSRNQIRIRGLPAAARGRPTGKAYTIYLVNYSRSAGKLDPKFSNKTSSSSKFNKKLKSNFDTEKYNFDNTVASVYYYDSYKLNRVLF